MKIWLSGNYNLSYHQSRHTFGTLLVAAGVQMESIAKMMGHTNIRTTQGYAKVTDDKISEDMDRLMEKRNSMVQVGFNQLAKMYAVPVSIFGGIFF